MKASLVPDACPLQAGQFVSIGFGYGRLLPRPNSLFTERHQTVGGLRILALGKKPSRVLGTSGGFLLCGHCDLRRSFGNENRR